MSAVNFNQRGIESDTAGSIFPDDIVTVELLQGLLAKFKIEAILDEYGDLAISEGFGPELFIRLEPKRHWIVFHTDFSTPILDEEQNREFANYLNESLTMAQFSVKSGGIGMEYFMYYRNGLNINQVMSMAQRFGSLACTAMKRLVAYSFDSGRNHKRVVNSNAVN